MTTFVKRLMRAMRLEDVAQLDELLSQPISQDAASHSETPDEEYDQIDAIYATEDLRREAQERFEMLSGTKYLN